MYSIPSELEIDYTLEDIAASTNSSDDTFLCVAIRRYRDTGLLPGVVTQDDKDKCPGISTDFGEYYQSNLSAVSLANVTVCQQYYNADHMTSIFLSAQLFSGLKPPTAGKATLTYRV